MLYSRLGRQLAIRDVLKVLSPRPKRWRRFSGQRIGTRYVMTSDLWRLVGQLDAVIPLRNEIGLPPKKTASRPHIIGFSQMRRVATVRKPAPRCGHATPLRVGEPLVALDTPDQPLLQAG